MSNDWFSPEILQRFAGSLLHFFWQGAVVAMVAAAGLRLAAHKPASWRYAVAVCALFLMFAAPIATFVFYAQTGAITLQLLQSIAESFSTAGHSASQTAASVTWTQWIVFAWAAGVVISSIRLATGWRFSRRLVRMSNASVPGMIVPIFNDVRSRLRVRKPIRLLLNAGIDTPAVVGWLRPVVLLPVAAITGLSELQLRAVLAHEMAHIRRHDFFVNAVQR